MDMKRARVVLGLLGSTLDAGVQPARWTRWRPSVAIAWHPEFPIDRLELLVPPSGAPVASRVAADIEEISPGTQVRQHPLTVADPWDFSEVYGALADFAERYPWKPEREDYYLHITTGTHVMQICLFLLSETRAMPARLLQSSPVRGGSREDRTAEGPRGRIDVIDLDLAKYERLAARFRARRARGESMLKAGIATGNAAFNRVIEQLEHVATRSRDPILIGGETGTGKSALCQRLFELKKARQHLSGELVAVNCATLRGDTAASALFGHAKGAFTGAAEARAGFLRKADKGLLFLDEIGELPLDEQAMLLKALEEKRFYPVGADKEVTSDFQLVAGSNRDLSVEVAAGRFREDLLARISLWVFELPPLRARPEDLSPNLEYELDRLGVELGHPVSMTSGARTAFLRFAQVAPWRANFRDFNAAIRRMVTLAEGGRVDERRVAEEQERLAGSWRAGGASSGAMTGQGGGGGEGPLRAVLGKSAEGLDRFDRVQLAEVIAVIAGSPTLSAAGRALFEHSRQGKTSKNDADRLRKYLARFELTFEEVRGRLEVR